MVNSWVSKFLFFTLVHFRDGGEEVFAFEEEGDGDVLEEVIGGAVDHAGEGNDTVELGDGAVDHGGDDVGVVDFLFEEVGDAEDNERTVEVIFKASKGELFVGAHNEFKREGLAILVEAHR